MLKLSFFHFSLCAALIGLFARGGVARSAVKIRQKLLVFLLDGFRWDYDDLPGLRGFPRIKEKGASATYLRPVFPSSSYPNYQSLVTGLYVESHGLLGNYVYDPKYAEYFRMGRYPAQYESLWWEGGEPVWITAEKQGRSSYLYFWPGCEVSVGGLRPTFCLPYTTMPHLGDLDVAIKESLRLFQNESADFIGIYVELPDKFGHKFGPDTQEVQELVYQLDARFDYLHQELEDRFMSDDVNIMLMSDHGMTSVSVPEHVLDIRHHVSYFDLERTVGAGAVTGVWPAQNKTLQVLHALSIEEHWSAYLREEIPDRWHYKHHYRAPPILLVADPGYYILTFSSRSVGVYSDTGLPEQGWHGYDNFDIDMQGIFAAYGPAFRPGAQTTVVEAVDMYQLMCKVLDVTPSPHHNGTWANVEPFLKNEVPYFTAQEEANTASVKSIAPSVVIIVIVNNNYEP
ncbi:ectonucleotide pyrophosphatase/phosphodiesterase family member 6-like [Lingula anatina]|uniref:glycerophosphocholine cholinephosphodiesterase n=1 Tax=Lingula anatina TaxID=7574 RepID=A0A1S3H8N6_LINAN|nr:ectonucleotide pyrophosphatase/phosphodiesterase family member 6-like [Lingula anatina]|eukprot:XP_013382373.1 ectonucleotide pyrophosphatase/phosphodiesterase family member 6-like [Lingula anatina]